MVTLPRLRPFPLLFAAALTFSTPGGATVIDGSVTGGTAHHAGGAFVNLTLPLNNPFGARNSVGHDTFQSPDLYAFNEDQNIVLGDDLHANIGLSVIPRGTKVARHYVFFDPGGAMTMRGTVSFDSKVLAIITSTDLLAASDFLAKSGVTYESPGFRGLETGEDDLVISGLKQITFTSYASTPGDYVRVLTSFSPAADSPEPATGLVGGAVLAAIYILRKRH